MSLKLQASGLLLHVSGLQASRQVIEQPASGAPGRAAVLMRGINGKTVLGRWIVFYRQRGQLVGISDVTFVAGGGAKAVDLGERTMQQFVVALGPEIARAASA
jgi:hypothetical protein